MDESEIVYRCFKYENQIYGIENVECYLNILTII